MITIIGAGRVGSAAAFDILKDHIDDVILIDLYEDLAKGEALDMMRLLPQSSLTEKSAEQAT